MRGKAPEINPRSATCKLLAKCIVVLFAAANFWLGVAQANPYLAKPGEAPLRLRIATCAVSGGFMHLYTALENGLFNKYGISFEPIHIQASAPSLAALAADEIQFLYCAADATIPTLAAGIGGKLVAAPLVKLT